MINVGNVLCVHIHIHICVLLSLSLSLSLTLLSLIFFSLSLSLLPLSLSLSLSLSLCLFVCVSTVDEWACEKPRDLLQESVQSAQSPEVQGADDSASEITYGEVEQRLDQLQEHLNRLKPLPEPTLCSITFTL